MPNRIHIGTDIATIGVWDPTRERHDLKTARYADYRAGLESEAHAGRLFFVNTGADGEYLTDIYVDEQPDPDCLSRYTATEREFLIESQSGQLIAGGLEDFINGTKQITSEDDQFRVAVGFYALRFYELTEHESADRLRDHIGAEDLSYYQRRSGGCSWLVLLFVIGITLLIAQWWLVSAGVFAVLVTCWVVGSRARACDHRYQEIARRVEAFDEKFPPFIYVLRRVADACEVQGGWHDLL